MRPADAVTVSILVAVDPATAFDVFTEDIDAWWKRGPRFRFNPARGGVLRFEPGARGRLIEAYPEGDVYEVGRVLAWEPARRLVFEFKGRAFEPGQSTEVEVRFAAEGERTRVTLEHRGWESLAPDHPARHGLAGRALLDVMGVGWGDLLVALQSRAKHEGHDSGP